MFGLLESIGAFITEKRNAAYLARIEKRLNPCVQALDELGIHATHYKKVLLKSMKIEGLLRNNPAFVAYVLEQETQARQDLEAARAMVEDAAAQYESLRAYAMSVGKQVRLTKNDQMIQDHINLCHILSSSGLENAGNGRSLQWRLDNLNAVKTSLSNLESMARAYPRSAPYAPPSKSPTPPLFEVGPRSLFTLLESCLPSPTALHKCHVDAVEASSAYRMWSHCRRFRFLSAEAKALLEEIEGLDVKRHALSCGEYHRLFRLVNRMEDEAAASLAALGRLDFGGVTIVHEDWLEFALAGRGVQAHPAVLPGLLTVTGTPEGAQVHVAGNRLGALPVENVLLAPGAHEVRVTARNHPDKMEVVQIIAGKKTVLRVELKQSWRDSIAGMEFIYVEPGEFLMGAASHDGFDSELDLAMALGLEFDDIRVFGCGMLAHVVRITRGFYLGRYPVTQSQWKKIMGGNPSEFEGEDNPVENVSWNDAREFIRKLNALEGSAKYRLPTEAEWEYAAGGGNRSQGYEYAGSDRVEDVACYKDNSGGRTRPVGTGAPNELGLYDMSGNVREWVQDWFDAFYYRKSPSVDPPGPDEGSARVVRGGAWNDEPEYVRVTFRNRHNPKSWNSALGFRLLREL